MRAARRTGPRPAAGATWQPPCRGGQAVGDAARAGPAIFPAVRGTLHQPGGGHGRDHPGGCAVRRAARDGGHPPFLCAGPRGRRWASGSGRTPTGGRSSRRSSSTARSTGCSGRKRWCACRPAAASVRPVTRRPYMSSDGIGVSGLGRLARLAGMALGLIALLVLLPTAMTYINPGYVGIVIHRVGGGVDPTPLGPGLHARNPLTTGIEEYPVVHADAGADPRPERRVVGERRDQRQQRRGPAALARRVDVVRAGSDARCRRSTRPSAPTSRRSSTAT